MYSEEHVTRATARWAVDQGWEIVAVHPPDGQGPFVIPREPGSRAIERSSYHPDIVAVRPNEQYGAEVLLGECKLAARDLEGDRAKLQTLIEDVEALLFIFFRCQQFEGGPAIGCDFSKVSSLPMDRFPIQFLLTAHAEQSQFDEGRLGPYLLTVITFDAETLARRG